MCVCVVLITVTEYRGCGGVGEGTGRCVYVCVPVCQRSMCAFVSMHVCVCMCVCTCIGTCACNNVCVCVCVVCVCVICMCYGCMCVHVFVQVLYEALTLVRVFYLAVSWRKDLGVTPNCVCVCVCVCVLHVPDQFWYRCEACHALCPVLYALKKICLAGLSTPLAYVI